MPKIDILTTKGEKKGTVNFDFDKKVSDILVANVIRVNLSNKRQAIASTKTRAEVRGGGRKPWRQKGTGRARHGSRRSPIWIGGGVTFGPTKERNFFKRINKKQRILVLARLINDKIQDKHLKIIEDIKIDSFKTKEGLKLLSCLKIDGPALIVLDKELLESDTGRRVYLAFHNLPFIEMTSVEKINAYMVAKYEWLVITKKAFKELKEKLAFIEKKENNSDSKS